MISYKRDVLERQSFSEVKMGRVSPICERVRKKIVECFKNNVPQRQIATSLQISSSTVHNIIKIFRETEVREMVWWCISALSMGSLHVLEGTVNAEMYIKVLEQHMLPSRWCLFQRRLVYFSRTMQNHILQLLQQHGFIVEEDFLGCRNFSVETFVMLSMFYCK